ARELCQQVGEAPPQLFSVLWGLYTFYFSQAELQTAHELGGQCLSLAQSVQDPVLLLEAHMLGGLSLYSQGEFVPAREHFAQGIALYDSQQHRSHALIYGQDPWVACWGYTAYALWQLGYPNQALKKIHEAFTLAQEQSHPFSLALTLGWAATFHQLHRDGHLAQERAEAAITFSIEHGFPFHVAWGTILQGWALAEQGQEEEGITQIRQGLAAWRATGVEVWRPYFLALLAEVYGKAGQPEEGLTVLAEALAVVEKTGERWYEAELYRLKGQLTLQSQSGPRQVKIGQDKSEDTDPRPLTPDPQAEACFLKAIEIARQQQAKSLELRAVMSLSRLWQQQGKKEEARQMLAKIYRWFTEGFDTKDLQEAKVLLEELADR
ncbi:MAG TPA: hypothetical protein VGX03_16930, partial [Candidatus Binatia bacterium]|nr:hypothetical protein [Candidatus Binatia bacterium]